jgi:hypothetical protein
VNRHPASERLASHSSTHGVCDEHRTSLAISSKRIFHSAKFRKSKPFETITSLCCATLLPSLISQSAASNMSDNSARLAFRPTSLHQRITSTLRHGLRKLNLAQDRDGLVFVPESVTTGVPAPVLLVLHGAGGHAANLITVFEDLAYHTGNGTLFTITRALSHAQLLYRYCANRP